MLVFLPWYAIQSSVPSGEVKNEWWPGPQTPVESLREKLGPGMLHPVRRDHRVEAVRDALHPQLVVGLAGVTGRVRQERPPVAIERRRTFPYFGAATVRRNRDPGAGRRPGVAHPDDVELRRTALAAAGTGPDEVLLAVVGDRFAVDRVLTEVRDLRLELVRTEWVVAARLEHVHPVVGIDAVGGGVVDVPTVADVPERGRPHLGVAGGVRVPPDDRSRARPAASRGWETTRCRCDHRWWSPRSTCRWRRRVMGRRRY